MLRPTKILLSYLTLFIAYGMAGAADVEFDKLQKQADAIRPTAEESLWTQVPWVRSVIEGQRLAREERRPIMYWHVDDDPLERC
jgi:hypothetical protein